MSGEKEYFFIGDNESAEDGIRGISGIWKSVLEYGVLAASHFEVRFPDDPCLGEGKDEFMRLPGISVVPWSGMEGAIAVTGSMTPEARALFLQTLEEDGIRLWDFILFRDGKKLLSVSDHSDRIVTRRFAREFMERLFACWFEPIPEPEVTPQEKGPGVALNGLREAIRVIITELDDDDGAG